MVAHEFARQPVRLLLLRRALTQFRILTSGGLALLFLACTVLTFLPWIALACATAAAGIGIYLHRHRQEVEGDALHLGRVLLLSGATVTVMAALTATDSQLKWIVFVLSTLPVLPAYAIGFYGLVLTYAVGYFILIGMIVASGPQKPPVSSGSTSPE